MTGIGWEGRVNALRQEVSQIANQAGVSSGQIRALQVQAECCKVQLLAHILEAKRKSLARNRGAASITQNGKGLPLAFGITAAASVLTAIVSKGRVAPADAGMSALNGALQGLGEAEWAVCLGRKIVLVPREEIGPGRSWLTWESVMAALNELGQRAQPGAQLGDFNAVILEVSRSKELVTYVSVVTERSSH